MDRSKYMRKKIGGHTLHPETQMMSYGYDPFMSEGSVKPPVFLTSTFAFKSAEAGADFFDQLAGRAESKGDAGLIYSRFNHPNLEIVEDRLALLDGGEACAVHASGMAAISAVFLTFLRPGDVIVQSSPLYGGTETLIRKLLPEFGIQAADFHNGVDTDAVHAAVERGRALGPVKMIYVETPANPTNSMIDFALITAEADRLEAEQGLRPLLVCDNTMLGPVFQRPLQHGFDLSVYSLTKYVGGHSDLVAGGVVGRSELIRQIKTIRGAYGSQLDPHSSWMIGRSLETLVLRMRQAATSGSQVARWLADNPHAPVDVLHPELIEDPAYQATVKRQASGPGSTFSFVLADGRPRAFKLINSLKLFKSAVSLGGTESLVCHPASTTHSGVSEDIRAEIGLSEGLIRISVGLEHPDDLIADLEQAFKQAF
ncbi:MAG: cystathionine gamma-synthase family protein [Pseudomonadales bacterium]